MNRRVDCYVGALRPALDLPALPLTLDHNRIEEYFKSFSTDAQGARHVDLRMNYDHLHSAHAASGDKTNASTLNKALKAVIGKQPQGGPTRVGLLFADLYEPRPGVLGYMFDEGAFPGDPAREGGAIFLDRIREFRANEGPQAVETEFSFVAVHELGHVFNLWHMHAPPNSPNFMSRSGPRVFDESAFFFDPLLCSFLYLNDSSSAAHPAGDAYGARPHPWPKGDDPFDELTLTRPKPHRACAAELHIAVHPGEFWPFEPVELDVQIRALGPGTRPVVLPDEIDPGYERFQIWIEEPDGERRRYRPPRRYCTNTESLDVAPKKPFRRDISIFVGAGGYTFRSPGLHRVWASLRLPNGSLLRSNEVEVDVKGLRSDLRQYREYRQVLANPRYARLLYHRSARLNRGDLDLLEKFTARYKQTPAAAGLNYALARHFSAVARRKAGAARKAATEAAVVLFRRALRPAGALEGHRRRVSQSRLAELARG